MQSMKRKCIVFGFIVIFLLVGLCGCNEKTDITSDGQGNEYSILGMWRSMNLYQDGYFYRTYREDGTLLRQVFKDDVWYGENGSYSYTFKGITLTIYESGNLDGVFQVEFTDNATMYLTSMYGDVSGYKRVK